MPHSSILDRFRPVGAPGPVGPVGVPGSGERGPGVELLPVFAALAPEIEAARILVEQAENEAADIVGRARDEASALLAQAQLDARAVRSQASARVTLESSDHDQELLTKASTQADALARAGTARLPEMTHTVISRMLVELRQQ